MKQVSAFIALAGVALDATSSVPMYRQLYETLRSAILSGRLGAGTRLPSTRALASSLNLSRNTVANAYEQLSLEGYFEGRVGSGTYVTHTLPDPLRRNGKSKRSSQKKSVSRSKTVTSSRISNRGTQITNLWKAIGRGSYRSNAFRPRLPALDAFPLDVWSRLTARRWRNMPSGLLTFGDPAGYRPLREVVASYLHESRGVKCEADQVIIVSGPPQAYALASAVLLDRGDTVWIEDPGYPRARATLMAADANLVPVPLDRDGLNLEVALSKDPSARMAYVTPAHQYPLGMKMSPARRLELLQWATQHHAWILEDDYGTEYRASGLPLAALQSYDEVGCVIYTGSFSSVLFPALRLGYLVVPPDLVDAFISARILIDRCPPLFGQVVLTDFIAENHMDRHTRRMRTLYERRQEALIEAIRTECGDLLEVHPDEAGLHLVAWLPEGANDQALSRKIAEQDIEAPPLSFYAVEPLQRAGFVLGYAAVDEDTIRIGVRRIRTVLESVF